MGGGGEGLMAVIHSLPAGLAIVLLDRKRQELDRREELELMRRLVKKEVKDLRNSRAAADSLPPPRRSAGVETDATVKTNTSSQICDGQYASTYQLAHCSLTPTSPPVDLPEFPPQRPAPCRNQGNFEVGGCGSGECYRSRSPSPPTLGFRGGMQWPDRGSVYSPRPQLERDDVFVNSLRKYPNAPEISPSAELVQRLISNTQAKLLKKTTHQHSKSLRNLGAKSSTHSKTNIKKSSKNLQTYTRTKKSEPVKEEFVVNYEIRKNKTRKKGVKASGMLQSPGCSREIRTRETFDYLNSSIPRPPPGKASGDRRVVKDSIRDSLRAVYGDGRGPVAAFNLCPRIRSRYEKHRRDHHGAGTSKQGSIHEAHGLKVHSSDSTLCDPNCKNLPTSRSKAKVNVICECDKPEIDKKTESNSKEKVDVSCVCGKPGVDIDKCSCRQDNSESKSKDKVEVTSICGKPGTDIDKCICQDNTESKSKEKVEVTCECDKPEIDSYIDKCICPQSNTETDVDKCVCPLDKLEIDECICHPNKPEVDKCECSSKKGKTYSCPSSCSKKRKLGLFEDDIDEEQELEEIINAWVEELPVSSKEKPNDETKRAAETKKLRETLSSMKDDKFDAKGKEEIKICIEKMPIWLPHDKDECDTFKDKIADELFKKLRDFRHRNTFKDMVEEWLDGIDFEDEKEIDRKALALDLSNELKKLDRKRSPNERLHIKKLKCKILDWLENLPIQTIGDKNDVLEKLADELIYKLLHYKETRISEGNPEIEPYIKTIINALNELPELTELSDDEKRRVSKNLLNRLPKTMLERNKDDNIEQICNIVRFVIIRNWLSQLAKDNKVEIDKPTQQDFVKNLILKLAEAHEDKNKNEHELILDFLHELPTPPDSNDPEIKKMIQELSNDLEESKPSTKRERNSSATVELLQQFGNQPPTSDTNLQSLTTTENWLKKWFEYCGTPVDPKTISILAKKLATKLSNSQRKTSHSAPMLSGTLDVPQKSKRPLVDDSSNRTNAGDMTEFESKFNDILENLVLRGKDESIAGEVMTLLNDLERAVASGNISNDIYDKLLSRVHELSENSNNDDIVDFMRDDSGRNVVTSTPRKQGRSREGSRDEEEQIRKVATSTPRRQGRGKDGSRDEEEQIRKVATSIPRRQSRARDGSTDEEEKPRRVATSTPRRQYQSRDGSRDEEEQIRKVATSTPRRQSRGRDGSTDEEEKRQKVATSTPRRQYQSRDGSREEEEPIRKVTTSTPRRQDKSRNGSRDEGEQIRKVATSTPQRQSRSRDGSTDEEENRRNVAISTPRRQDQSRDGSRDEEEPIRKVTTSTLRRRDQSKNGNRDEGGQIRKVATSTPQRQSRSRDGSTDEEENRRKVAISTPRRQDQNRDGSPDVEGNIEQNKSKDVRRYNTDQSKDERQTSPNRDQRQPVQSKVKNKDEKQSSQSKKDGNISPLNQSRNKSNDQRQPGTIKFKSPDESDYYKELHDKIQDWINQLNLNLNNKDKELVTDIANDLEDRRKYLQVNPNAKTSDEEELEHMKYQIFKRFNKLVDTRTMSRIMSEVPTLMDSLKGKLANLANSTDRDNHVSGASPMSQIDDVVRNWCNNLPLPDTPEGDAKKQDLHDRVMVKIGELNMNPKILNDDTLYEDMLFDSIDEELSGLPINNDDNIKAALMGPLNRIRKKLKENWAGQAYKQQLRNSITKSSPSTSNLTEDEQASFEIMKDDLADAYINLHYVAGDENLRNKFKDKINKEIDRFCSDYLKRHPDNPLNTTQLNNDLYSALKKVDVPRDESMRSEVELCKMKDIIDDWAKELHLDKETSKEKLQRNKNTTLLAQKLHELEKENELTPDDQYEQKLSHEIEKYLKKLLLQNKTNLKGDIDRLIDMLKNTKHSRTFTYGSRRSIDDGISEAQGNRRSMGEDRSRPQTGEQQSVDQQRSGPQFSKLQEDQGRSGPQSSRLSVDKGKYFQNCPASCLGRDDQAHLQRIRERNTRQQESERKTLVDQERSGLQGGKQVVDQGKSRPQGSRLSVDREKYFQNCPASCLGRDDQAHLQRIRERNTRQEESETRSCCLDSTSFVKQSLDAAVNQAPMDHGNQVNMDASQHQQVQCRCPKPGNRSLVIQSPCSSRSQMPMTECRRQTEQVSTGSQIEVSPFVVIKEYFWDNPSVPEGPRPPSPPTPLPALSSCCILPQSKPLSQRHSRNRPRVTTQRSFHDDAFTEACRRPTLPRHCGRPVRDDFSWECPKDEHDHGTPKRMWSRPHIYRDNEGISPSYSSERKESSVRCRCGGKISSCRIRNPVICQLCHDDPMKYCPRCCGTLCPHPTDFYFR